MPVRTDRRRSFSVPFAAAAACAFALVVAAYSNVFGNAFHFDDAHVLEENVYVRSLANAGSFFTDVRTTSVLPQNRAYRPLVTLSLAIDYAIGKGLAPAAFHADQLLQLLLLGTAVYVLYRRVFETAAPGPAARWLALFGAALFCVHTTATETMNLMHARSEILSAIGVVCGFLLYLDPRLRRLQLHLVPMAIGALAKTPAVLLGPLLFAWEVVATRGISESRDFGRRLRSALKSTGSALVAGVALFVFVEKIMAPQSLDYGGGPRLAYAQTQLWVWVHYLRLFALPVGLSADTDLGLLGPWWDTRIVVGACVLAALAWTTWRCARSSRAWPIAFGLAWFAIALLPTSSVLPLAEPLNEHRVFLPYIGLVVSAVWAVRLGVERRAIRTATVAVAAVLVLGAFATGTHVRNRVWRTKESLWADVTTKSPRNGRAWMNYGLQLMARGDYVGARACYDRAALFSPNYWALETNIAIVEDAMNHAGLAEPHFRRALELGPGMPDAHYFYARWLARNGRGREAVAELRVVLGLSPGAALARALLMDLLAASGDAAGAASLAAEALALDPTDARARAYRDGGFPDFGPDAATRRRAGIELGQRGDFVASAVAYRAALAADPSDADALNNLGWTLGKIGYFAEGIAPLERAIALRPDFTLAKNNLAWVKSQIR